MDVRSGRGAVQLGPERQKRDAELAEMFHECSAFWSVRVDRNVHRVAVVEPHAVVHRGLAERAHGELASECVLEKLLDLARVSQRPLRPAIVENQ